MSIPITCYLWRDEADLPRILNLVHQMPLACPHAIDLLWRLSALHREDDRAAAFWENSNGQVIGFAACQFPWATLDFFVLSGDTAQRVTADLFARARFRFQERKEQRLYCVEYRDDDHARDQVVQAEGFVEEEDHYAWFERPLAKLPPAPSLPDQFTLRPLAGESEVAAYAEAHRAAFQSLSMTPAWRARVLRTLSYRPALGLAVTAPDGSIAGLCVSWFDPSRRVAQIEPMGGIHVFSGRAWGVSFCWRSFTDSKSKEPYVR
ncbi:MAG TPA: N-acetyltransferase [Ktedonobacterales bacterium]|nr:N-acetyltransferase [Ktedonobacterales bacterium]